MKEDIPLNNDKAVSADLGSGRGASLCSQLRFFPAGLLRPPAQSAAACPCTYPRWGNSPRHHWPRHTYRVNVFVSEKQHMVAVAKTKLHF